MGYHNLMVEYTHRCECGCCVHVITHSPALPENEINEARLAQDVFRLHMLLNGRAIPNNTLMPPQIDPSDTDDPQ